MLCAPFLVILILFAVQAAQQDQWGRLTGFICVVLIFLTIPVGELRLRHAPKGREPVEPPSSLI